VPVPSGYEAIRMFLSGLDGYGSRGNLLIGYQGSATIAQLPQNVQHPLMHIKCFKRRISEPRSLDEVIRLFDRHDFNLVAVGRPLIADVDGVKKIQSNAIKDLKGFKTSNLKS